MMVARLAEAAVGGGLATETLYTVLTVLGASALAWLSGGEDAAGVPLRAG